MEYSSAIMWTSGLGEGNYRLVVDATSNAFSNVTGKKKERKIALLFSFDQQLGEILGAWAPIRAGRTMRRPLFTMISFPEDWTSAATCGGRENDNAGIGYAYLGGGNLDVDHTAVFEVYGRFALNDIFAVTGDVQYMKDAMKAGNSPEGWIFGLRATAEF